MRVPRATAMPMIPTHSTDRDVIGDGMFDASGPPQVPLFKSTQYVGNVLSLADILVELIYELLPSTSVTLRSGQSVAEIFEISELSLASRWVAEYKPLNPHDQPEPSLFWTTLFDFVEVQTENENDSFTILLFIKNQLALAIAEADDDQESPVLFQFHLNVVMLLLGPDSPFAAMLSLDDIVQLGNFLYRFRTTLTAALAYSFPELTFTEPLDKNKPDGWSLEVDAVVQVHLPATAAEFLTWTLTGKGAEIFLHFDRIVLDDATGLVLVNPNENNDGKLRFPFGGSLGDLTLNDVVVNVSVGGELAKAAALPIGPYHRYREAFFTKRYTPCEPTENLVDLSLTVGSVDLELNPTTLTTVAGLLILNPNDAVRDLEDAIEGGLEALRDFGSIGDAVAGAFAPFLPDAAALQTHDFYKPFTDEHLTFTYDGLRIEGDGRGIHILNDAPEPSDPASSGGNGRPDPEPGDLDPPILDNQDPIPVSGWTDLPRGILTSADEPDVDQVAQPMRAGGHSPHGNLVLAVDQRPRYLARFNAMSGVPPVQDAAVRLWLDGVPPHAIAWIRGADVARSARMVAGRSVSVETLASLDRLAASGAGGPDSFLFATSPRWPSTNGTLTSLLAPLDHLARTVTAGTPHEMAIPLQYALESSLARRKGSSVDPFWVGLSVNVVAVSKALGTLAASDTFGQSGTVEYGNAQIPFRVDLAASKPAISVDLTGAHGSRPVATISGLTMHLDEERQPATYTVTCQVAMDAVKPDPGCVPDEAIGAFVYNRSCVSGITDGGQITDSAYLEQLIYRYFVHLRFMSDEAKVTRYTLTAGVPVGSIPVDGRTTSQPPTQDTEVDDALMTVQEDIIGRAVRAILATVFTTPVVFDPYYARSPVIRSYEAKDGWLNIYETYS